jgi:hypothetical protein
MSELDAYEGTWVSADRYVGGVILEIRFIGPTFTVRRFDDRGVPYGVPVEAIPWGGELIAQDVADDEVGALTFRLTEGGAALELWMADADRPIRFVRGRHAAGGESSAGT